MKLPRVKEGDPITADLFNRLFEVAESCRLTVGQGSGLSLLAGPDGYTLSAVVSKPIWGKITGAISSGTYPFTLQFEGAAGTWTDGPLTGLAYEVSGNTAVPIDTYVKLWWTSSGDWRFLAGSC
jgi:hypothetical protein